MFMATWPQAMSVRTSQLAAGGSEFFEKVAGVAKPQTMNLKTGLKMKI